MTEAEQFMGREYNPALRKAALACAAALRELLAAQGVRARGVARGFALPPVTEPDDLSGRLLGALAAWAGRGVLSDADVNTILTGA